jgi:hypothetical protein
MDYSVKKMDYAIKKIDDSIKNIKNMDYSIQGFSKKREPVLVQIKLCYLLLPESAYCIGQS